MLIHRHLTHHLHLFSLQVTSSLLILSFAISLATAYGFDSGGACEPRGARRGRAQLLASIPCDLSTQSYCNLPGSAYPWHAVRRFVHENQGLMKRMYGDIKHISVFKGELEGNFIETEDIEVAIERYSMRKQQRAMKLADKKNRRSDTILEPHFRLQSTTTSSTSTASTSPRATTSATPAMSETTATARGAANITAEPASADVKDKYIILNETVPGEAVDAATTPATSSTIEESVTVVTLANNATQKTEEAPPTTPTGSSSTPQTLLSDEVSLEELTGHEGDHGDDDEDLEYSDRSPHPQPPTMEGQLFQDTLHKEPAPPVNTRGV